MSRKLIGHVGVDSGQLVVTDPCYLKEFDSHDDVHSNLEPGQSLNDDLPPKDSYTYSYGGACAASCNADQGGNLDGGSGVAIRTGFGDGFYPVFAEYEDTGFAGTRVKRLVVEFFSDEEEDSEENV